ncbi:MAG: hypothetical protein R2764_14410 [Bacteroidales bacterium]
MIFKAVLNFFFSVGIVFLMFFSNQTFSQDDDASWWNSVQDWDGVTPWQSYIIYSPSYMGINALPVPFSQKGRIKDRYELEVKFESHFSPGDKTQNLFLSLYLPLVKDFIAFEFYGVPVENYKMTEETVIERRGRNRSGKGYAAGDLYFSSIIQIIKNRGFPDLAFRMACKTASGSRLSDARYTDAPGYFFDLSVGKDYILFETQEIRIRPHATIGFNSWQMNLPNNRQNDAVMVGLGIDLHVKSFILSNSIDGYLGYFGNEKVIVGNPNDPVPFKDRPMVYRLDFTKGMKRADLALGYQAGLHDFSYQTINFSLIFHLENHNCPDKIE